MEKCPSNQNGEKVGIKMEKAGVRMGGRCEDGETGVKRGRQV